MESSTAIKVVLIGAGSANFGPATAHDMLQHVLDGGGELSLVDTREEAARNAAAVTRQMATHMKVNARVTWSVDRREALPGANVVIVSAEVDRIQQWRVDWEIPHRFDIRHTLGENRGPAGLSHGLRTIPLILQMARDIEELAPQALVMVMTNPEDRLVYALNRYTTLQSYGYCDGLWDFKSHYLGPALGIPGERMYVDGTGINHAVWITHISDLETGEDLYPRMVAAGKKGDFEPFGYHLYNRFGLWPHENDEHYGEYFSYAGEFIPLKGYDFDEHERMDREWKDNIRKTIDGEMPIVDFLADVEAYAWHVFGDSPPSHVVRGCFLRQPTFIQNANIPNNGKVPGLPDDMIVELPATATPSGIHGFGSRKLPDPILAFLHREATIQKFAAEAAAEGSRNKALIALELDPQVATPATAEQLLDAFLEAHASYIPQTILQGLRNG